ncbi:hypothetical protein ABS71_14345 [bacterium SCN 62-11]|mgnify:CR=1 FL=1|nr:hypothetical protein [Candidatus Eremiobacteraeota bacterium]ODT63434.1 MAG: hypothetical protein ABS71_14345 [bacterium SCN 62-11]
MKRRGFSVLELTVSSFCLALISAALFYVFNMCSSGFRLGMTRQGLQNQITGFSARFTIDVRQSSMYAAWSNSRTVNVEADPGVVVPLRRDALCLSALRDPGSPASYETATGLPRWDCFWVYTSTDESPTGRLMRFRCDQPPSTAQFPLADFRSTPNNYFTIPSPRAVAGTSQTLAHGLHKFEASLDQANQQVLIRIAFRGEHGRTVAGRSLAEIAETMFRVKPENSWPRL